MNLIEIGEEIRKRRNILKITQLHLAEMAEISESTILRIEKGQANPTLEVLMKIADILGLELKLEVKNK